MNIRKLSPADALEVAALWHEGTTASGEIDSLFLPRLSIVDYAERIHAMFTGGSIFGWCVVSKDKGRLIGYLTAEIIPISTEWQMDSYLHILDVDITSSSRQKGCATKLLQAAIEHAKCIGLRRIELSWLAKDPRSSAVWAKLGFEPYLYRGFLHIQPGLDSSNKELS